MFWWMFAILFKTSAKILVLIFSQCVVKCLIVPAITSWAENNIQVSTRNIQVCENSWACYVCIIRYLITCNAWNLKIVGALIGWYCLQPKTRWQGRRDKWLHTSWRSRPIFLWMFWDICHTFQNICQNIDLDLQPVCSHLYHHPWHCILNLKQYLLISDSDLNMYAFLIVAWSTVWDFMLPTCKTWK